MTAIPTWVAVFLTVVWYSGGMKYEYKTKEELLALLAKHNRQLSLLRESNQRLQNEKTAIYKQYEKVRRELAEYRTTVADRRLKHNQFLMVENAQLHRELDMYRNLWTTTKDEVPT
jgi:transposase